MNKRLIIFFAVVLFVLLAFLAWIVFYSKDRSSKDGDKLNLSSRVGQEILVNNFKNTSLNFSEVSVLYSDSDYTIQYDDKDQSFQITFSLPTLDQIKAVRNNAERKLLDSLEIDESTACNLRVRELIPQTEVLNVSPNEFSMSFCIGGDNFPTTSNNQ